MNETGFPSFQVNARGFVHATPQQAWRVLTDYEHLAEFVPNMVHSKILSRGPHDATVEQVSQTSFLFMSHTVRMVVHIDERPFTALKVKLVSGDMQYYLAHWALAKATRDDEDGTLITYSGSLEPAFYLPPLLGQPLVQAQVQKVVAAVVTEVEERSSRKR